MNIRVLIATVVATVGGGAAGFVVFRLLLRQFMSAHTSSYAGLSKTPPNMITMFLAGFSFYLLGTLIFEHWAQIRTFRAGMVAGLWIGFLSLVSTNLMFYSFLNIYDPTGVIVDIIANTLIIGLMGGVIGAILGVGRK